MKRSFIYTIQSMAAALFVCVSLAGAQETDTSPIQIVDQNGKGIRSVEVDAGAATARAQAGVRAQAGGAARGGIQVQSGGGEITITDAQGKQRQLSVQGPQSIIVNRGSKTVVVDGEEKTESFGKAIFIGPDGKRQEIELGGPGTGGLFEFPAGFNGAVRANRVVSKFMIGVNCGEVGAALASQLRLEPGTGLVVQSIAKDSPAEKAGFEKHDILMFAEDKQLSNVGDLQKVVDEAGKDKSEISFTLIRGGKEVGVDVSPIERPAGAVSAMFGPEARPVWRGLKDFDLQMKQALPGMIVPPMPLPRGRPLEIPAIGNDFHKEMKAEMDQMRQQMEALSKQMNEQLKDK